MKPKLILVFLTALLALGAFSCKKDCDRCQVTLANSTAYDVDILIGGNKVKTLAPAEFYITYILSGRTTHVEADIQTSVAHSDLDLNLFCPEVKECREFFYTIKL